MLSRATLHPTSRSSWNTSQSASYLDVKGKVTRFLLATMTLCLLIVSGESSALAAPIGMCADTAQSVEAPPPMFPAEDTALNRPDQAKPLDCNLDDNDLFAVQHPTNPGERLTPSSEIPDHKVVLGELVPVLAARSVRTTVWKDRLSLPEEHRWRGLRPPRI